MAGPTLFPVARNRPTGRIEMPKAISLVVVALLLTGCKNAINDFLDIGGPTPIGPQSVDYFNGVGTIAVGGCRLEGPMSVSTNRGHRFEVSTDNVLNAEQLLACGLSTTGYHTPIIFEATVTARMVAGRLEISAPTGPRPDSPPLLIAITPQDPEVRAQLTARAPVTERNGVVTGLYGDNYRDLRLTVTIDTVSR